MNAVGFAYLRSFRVHGVRCSAEGFEDYQHGGFGTPRRDRRAFKFAGRDEPFRCAIRGDCCFSSQPSPNEFMSRQAFVSKLSLARDELQILISNFSTTLEAENPESLIKEFRKKQRATLSPSARVWRVAWEVMQSVPFRGYHEGFLGVAI
jgi:hypothetical protein